MAKRRAQGEGSVSKRADGRWQGRVVIGRKENGTPIYKFVFAKTQKDLLPKMREVLREYEGISLTSESNLTLAEWLEQWLKDYAELTYAELNAKANQLARKLRDLGVQPDDFVAMLTERSLEMVIGIYGILKAGGAYVPMDPTYPEERIRYMLEDCKPKAVLTYHAVIETDIPIIDLADSEVWIGAPENLDYVNKPSDLAYCIYTSGTTGKPKGVTIEHQGLHNLIVAYTKQYELEQKDIVLQAANYIFDQSVWDIFNIMVVGGTLCLISYDDVRDPDKVAKYCSDKQVTAAALTPALISELKPEAFQTLRLLESGGEAAREGVLKRWVTEKRRVFNTYGPTENTVNSSSYMLKGSEGYMIPMDVEKVRESFQALINRHEGLRTSFGMEDGELVQRIAEEVQGEIEYEENFGADEESIRERFEDFVRPFDLSQAPLMRIKVLKTGEAEQCVFFDMHHIISDGMSMNMR